jgi:hypothetical protein
VLFLGLRFFLKLNDDRDGANKTEATIIGTIIEEKFSRNDSIDNLVFARARAT